MYITTPSRVKLTHFTVRNGYPSSRCVRQIYVCCHASTRFHSIGCLVIQRQPSIPGRRRIVATSWPSPADTLHSEEWISLVAVCQADLRLLSCIDPLPLDRLSCHTAAAIHSWPSTDRRHIQAVAIRDIRVARQNLAELQLYSIDTALGRRRRNHPDVGRTTSPSGGGDQSSPG